MRGKRWRRSSRTTGSTSSSWKRRSFTKQPPDLVFFTDRDLGNIVPDALARTGVRVERHDDHFGACTLDVEWLVEVGRRGWIALTHNKEIRYNALERDMVMRAGVPLFMLIGKHPHPVLAENLVRTLPRVLRFLQRTARPFIARIYKAAAADFTRGKPGRVDLWLSYDDWKKLIGASGR